MTSAKQFVKWLLNDPLLLFFGILMPLLILFRPESFYTIPKLIHWPTISALVALLITTTGLKESGLIQHGADWLIHSVQNKQALWLSLVLSSAVSSMFLTNDIALFLIIPFTLHLADRVRLNIRPLLILETIAVNVGSMLTPIGNPQNIYLWQSSGVSFFSFITAMLPITFIELVLLLVAVFFIADIASFSSLPASQPNPVDYKLALISVLMLLGFLIAHHFGHALYATICIAFLFLIISRKTFSSLDWSLIILFLLLFIDTGIISSFAWVDSLAASISDTNPLHILVMGAGYSQLISNVPATLLLSHYTDHWKYLAWGVNIGGNGVLIASFANLITMRLASKKRLWLHYHYYAIPFGLLSIAFIYLFLF